jgi:imidazolonepropionase-like amidohydrolase
MAVRLSLLISVLMMLTPRGPVDFELAIRHCRVIVGNGQVLANGTVFISGGRIARVDDTRAADRVISEKSIDATGRTLVPGLIDAHVHVEPWTVPLFLKYGVTSVRDLNNDPAYIFPLAREDAASRPRIVAAGALIDGPGSFWKNAIVVDDPLAADAAVQRAVAAGAGVIKVYTRLRPALIAEIVQEARARGVPVAAHLGRTTAVQAAFAGVTSIEHLTGIPESVSSERDRLISAHDDFFGGWTAAELEWASLDPAALDRVARTLIEQQVVLVPTLALHEAFSRLADPLLQRDPALSDVPDSVKTREWDPADIMGRAHWTAATLAGFARSLAAMQRFVRRYVQLGGHVAAGTDTPQQFVVPGASLHRELQLYVAAGLSPAAALRTATAEGAALLGIADRAGTIAVGKDADLVLVDGDPLADITALSRIVTVLRNGQVVVARPAPGR